MNLQNLAATAGLSTDDFNKKFGYLIENDLLYQFIREGKFTIAASESNLAHRINAENGDSEELDD